MATVIGQSQTGFAFSTQQRINNGFLSINKGEVVQSFISWILCCYVGHWTHLVSYSVGISIGSYEISIGWYEKTTCVSYQVNSVWSAHV